MGFLRTHRRLKLALGVLGITVLTGALVVFKPWLLLVDKEVNDQIPTIAAPSRPVYPDGAGAQSAAPQAQPNPEHSEQQDDQAQSSPGQTPAQQTPSGPVLVSSGKFISHEHETSGTASIVRHPDGSHQLILENLNTSNGPDVRVWLSAGPVVEGRAGWFTAGNHEHLDVAPIKGNLGNQVYDLPADFDPSRWPTVDLWCEDFSVSFGAAALSPAA